MQATDQASITLTQDEKAFISHFFAETVIPAQRRAIDKAQTHEQRFQCSNLGYLAYHQVWLALRDGRETITTRSMHEYVRAFGRLYHRRPYLFTAEGLRSAHQMQVICVYVLRAAIHALCPFSSANPFSLQKAISRFYSWCEYLTHRERFRRMREKPVIDHLYQNEFFLQNDTEGLFTEVTIVQDNTRRKPRFWE